MVEKLRTMNAIASIRKIIADRLQYEIKRRGLNSSASLGVPKDVLNGYLRGTQEIKFSELTAICNQLGINPVRLIYSQDYPKLNIVYRNAQRPVQKTVSMLEDVFLLIEPILPSIEIPQYDHVDNNKYSSIKDIISEAAVYASKVREKHPSPEDFISDHSIPLFPVKSNDKFDAFVITKDNHAVICINMNNAPQRIRFSLAHEICHLLFDRQREIAVDVFLPELYWKDKFKSDEVPELFAYKFAEFYLVPYKEVYLLTLKWPDLDLSKCEEIINNYKISKDVLANAIRDILLCSDKSVNFQEIKSILQPLNNSKDANSIFLFLEEARKELSLLIDSHSFKYSDKILNFIKEVLQFDV